MRVRSERHRRWSTTVTTASYKLPEFPTIPISPRIRMDTRQDRLSLPNEGPEPIHFSQSGQNCAHMSFFPTVTGDGNRVFGLGQGRFVKSHSTGLCNGHGGHVVAHVRFWVWAMIFNVLCARNQSFSQPSCSKSTTPEHHARTTQVVPLFLALCQPRPFYDRQSPVKL
jgi:hypothetical protein